MEMSSTICRYDKEVSLWKAKNALHPNLYAISKAPLHTHVIGYHLWEIRNDSHLCHYENTERYELIM